jgi:hypothetical protein
MIDPPHRLFASDICAPVLPVRRSLRYISDIDISRLAPGLCQQLAPRSRFAWSLSNLVALLRMQLFTHRDPWAWLDRPFEAPLTVLTASQEVFLG